jgi:hypothetical protein
MPSRQQQRAQLGGEHGADERSARARQRAALERHRLELAQDVIRLTECPVVGVVGAQHWQVGESGAVESCVAATQLSLELSQLNVERVCMRVLRETIHDHDADVCVREAAAPHVSSLKLHSAPC